MTITTAVPTVSFSQHKKHNNKPKTSLEGSSILFATGWCGSFVFMHHCYARAFPHIWVFDRMMKKSLIARHFSVQDDTIIDSSSGITLQQE